MSFWLRVKCSFGYHQWVYRVGPVPADHSAYKARPTASVSFRQCRVCPRREMFDGVPFSWQAWRKTVFGLPLFENVLDEQRAKKRTPTEVDAPGGTAASSGVGSSPPD